LRAEIRRSTVVPAPVEELWAILRDFNGHALWSPAFASTGETTDAPHQIGAVRSYRVRNGARIREQLLALSDRRRSLTYCIQESTMPLRNFVASMQLRPITADNACFWVWSASFDPPPSERERLVGFVRDDLIEAGFADMRDFLRARHSQAQVWPARPVRVQASVEGVEIVLTRHGGPEVLQPRVARIREPLAGEARIRQLAVGVNFIDVYCRRGAFDLVRPGGVLGMEAAGVVEAVGPNVASVRPGDRVAYACAPPGAYASIRTMRADLLVRPPEGLGEIEAAALLLKGVTAGFLLHDVASVRSGSIILVHAAAGGVGQILCRWAKALGATVIGATSSEAKVEEARAAGCAKVTVYGRDDILAAVRDLTSGRGVDIVYDAVGKDTFELSVETLAPLGHLVSFGQASGDVGVKSIDRLADRSLTVSRPNYVHYMDTPAKIILQADRLFEALRIGAVVAPRPRSYPLTQASMAHADLEGRKTTGSLVLIP
jgi:NADPH:quinone reductase-like Zn-dependent oxidoreductase